jgi:AcrR family transcriptional regulator
LPKIVDHDLRRRELAQAAVRIIAREGLEAATTRAVAAESGWSTGVLKYYFTGRDDLLHHALRELEAVNTELLEVASSQPSGYQQLRTALLSILAGNPDHSKVWIAFMSRAAVDPDTANEMRRGAQAWQRRWHNILVRGQQDGSIRADLDPVSAATELWALVSGMRVAALFHAGLGGSPAALEMLKGIRDDPPPRPASAPSTVGKRAASQTSTNPAHSRP